MITNDSIIKGTKFNREVTIDGQILSPIKSQGVYNHSPDGFNWNYGGSGPAQLALALMLEVLPQNDALRYYQDFKWDVIAGLEGDFEFKGEVILKWLKEKNAL